MTITDPPSSAIPITGSLRSDVLLLSTYLSGRQSSSFRPSYSHENMDLFVNISTLLAIGNNHNHSAVMGKATPHCIEFLVCAVDETSSSGNSPIVLDETGGVRTWSAENQQKGISGRDSGDVGDLVGVTSSRENGRKLLHHWDPDTSMESGVEISSDLTFAEHLQDLFDVITALDCEDTLDLIRFELFIHHRAFKRLGRRVLALSTHWGESPFDIISNHLDPDLDPKTFEFQYHDTEFHRLIQNYVNPEPALPSTSGTISSPSYTVNADNASKWIAALQDLWVQLQCYLLVKIFDGKTTTMTVRQDSPTIHTVDNIVAVMFFFEGLMPVLKHLLSAQGATQALANAEDMQRKKSEDVMQMKETGEDDLDLLLDNDDSSAPLPHSPERLLRAMKTMLVWQASCRHIFKKARRFRSDFFQWRLSRFSYHDHTLSPCVFNVQAVSHLLQESQGLLDKPCGIEDTKRIIRQTRHANVHAEAALMHWIATVKDVDSIQDWPIGVSDKCCQMCWLLHLAYNSCRSSKFVLPGTHGTFYPWLPPPGLPDHILIILRKALLAACKAGVSVQLQLSSVDPAEVPMEIPSMHRLKHAFRRLQSAGAQE